MERKRISGNTSLYRFRLPQSNGILGLPIGQHISLQANIDGKDVQRSYTPTSSDDDRGFFDLIIKTYPNGNISKHVDELKIGEFIQVKGPKGQMHYTPELADKIGMIAGGTGFTPCLQIIRAALKNPQDKTQINFIYANVTQEDILLKDELDRLARDHSDRFTVNYFLNDPPEGWSGDTGFISKEAIKEYLPGPEKGNKILMCGPPPMINACKKHLDELGYDKPRTVSKMEDQVFCF
jgi:cytochrome-b5 reductase